MTSKEIIRNVAFVTNVVPIYRYPIFELLNRNERFNLQILVTVPLSQSCREAIATLPIKQSVSANFRYTTHHGSTQTTQQEPFSVPLAVVMDLIRIRPDIVVSGDLGVRSLVCWISAKLIGARFVLWSEDIKSSAIGRSRPQQWLRRFLVRRADAFLAWGDPARRYLSSLSVPTERIFVCAQAIDNEYWLRQARTLDRLYERQALGFAGSVFLLVGRALPLKGFQNFLKAWTLLPKEMHSQISAVLVGDGEYLPTLRSLAADLGLKNVNFVGAKSADDLARFYAAADYFVFPSLVDVWGLVVNEAMCFGLPILASRYAGASQALVARSDVGREFDPANIDEFASLLRCWIESPPGRRPEKCHEILKDVTFNASSVAIRRMIDAVTLKRSASVH